MQIQSPLKKQNGKYQPKNVQKLFFASVPNSPTQMGSLNLKAQGRISHALAHLNGKSEEFKNQPRLLFKPR